MSLNKETKPSNKVYTFLKRYYFRYIDRYRGGLKSSRTATPMEEVCEPQGWLGLKKTSLGYILWEYLSQSMDFSADPGTANVNS